MKTLLTKEFIYSLLTFEDGVIYLNENDDRLNGKYDICKYDHISTIRSHLSGYVLENYPQASVTFKDGLTVGKLVSYFYRQGKVQSLKIPKIGEDIVPASNNLLRANDMVDSINYYDDQDDKFRAINKEYIILNATDYQNDDMYSQPTVLLWRKSPYFIDEDGCLNTIVLVINSEDTTIAMIKMTPYKAEQI